MIILINAGKHLMRFNTYSWRKILVNQERKGKILTWQWLYLKIHGKKKKKKIHGNHFSVKSASISSSQRMRQDAPDDTPVNTVSGPQPAL